VVQPGTLLEGKYEILDKIREGGMGSIYRVRHRLLEEIRVVKVMKPNVVADEDLRRRFVEEARTATRLKHTNICTIHDFAIDDTGMAFLVMEFIDGVSVSDLLKLHGRPALPLALEIAHQSLLALGFLHRKGIVHRDVAPDNIMLARDEQGGPLVKLIDLGIAKVAEAPVEATATGVFLGKLKYASPEQYGSLPRGHKLDGRSDLYGLGIVLYELLTGVLPFEGDTVVELLKAHVFSPPRPFSQSDPEGRVPTELRGAVLKALEKKREDRFENAEEFDREVLAIRSRYTRPEDLEETRVALARIRPSGGTRVESATPSAQGEMDRQFAAVKTPTPSRKTADNERTAVAPEPSAPARTAPSLPVDVRSSMVATTPIPRPPRTMPIWIVAAAAAALALAALLWTMSLRGKAAPAGASAPAPTAAVAAAAPVPTMAVVAALEPSVGPAAEPTAETEEPTPEPPRPTVTVARREPTRRPAPSPRVERPAAPAAAPIPPAVMTTAVAAPSPPTSIVEPMRPTPPPTVRPVPTEADRIRDTVRLYETAQNTLNVDLYVRVFPGVDRERIAQAFSSFRSQSVQFEIRRIEMGPQGSSAQVFGHETRVAVPKAGNDLRVTADRVLQLEKRGDAWVIVSVR
jgi:serine/threonine-protein kinase